jgi:hypothetical protein
MLQNLKPLLVILFTIAIMHWGLKRWFSPGLLPAATFNAISAGWALVSLALFLSPNFWVFLLVSTVAIWRLGSSIHPAPLFCGLLYAAPYLDKVIPGIGGINALFGLSYPRVLAVTALVLWWVRWREPGDDKNPGPRIFDFVVVILGIYRLLLQMRDDTITNTLREYSYYLIDITLVYWIGRRWLANRTMGPTCIAAFCYGVMIVCAIASFEFLKRWLLYTTLDQSLDVPGSVGSYLARGDTGLLRTFATTGHSIPMGYLAMVGIILWISLSEGSALPLKVRAIGVAILMGGSIASLSRGPWVALAGALLLWFSMSPQGLKRLASFAVGACALFAIALLTPAKDEIISMIPWVGEADSANIDYREMLIRVSLFMIAENPWFGSSTFMTAPVMQQLIQGQGIIDLVNTYIALALSSGLIGTSLFAFLLAGPLLYGITQYLRLLKQARLNGTTNMADPIYRGLLSVLFGTIIAIGTVSSITIIPWTYWLFMGTTVGFVQYYALKKT